MSISYKLFGIPKTIDEFVTKVKKNGNNKVDVILRSQMIPGLFGDINYKIFVSLTSGKTILPLNKYSYSISGFETFKSGAFETGETAIRESIEIAEKLQTVGLEATICGKSIDQARSDYKKEIRKYNNKRRY